MKTTKLLICFFCFSILAGLTSCSEKEKVYISDPDDVFPMEIFTDYLPYHVGDTLYYDRYGKKFGKNEEELKESEVPFIVSDVLVNYKPSDIYSYNGEVAECHVQFKAISSLNTLLDDSLRLVIDLKSLDRTRITASYQLLLALPNMPEPVATGDELKFVNSSDKILNGFPTDILTFGSSAELRKGLGLTYFKDNFSLYTWQLSDKNYN
jgi:hypothetical protein